MIVDLDIYLYLSRKLGLDFGWLQAVIDDGRSVTKDVAQKLAQETGTKEHLWTRDGKSQERLVAVKVWGLKQRKA